MISLQQTTFEFVHSKTVKHRHRKNHNQYFTPEFAVEKALSLMPLETIDNVIDPAVGNGIFLKMAAQKWANAKLFGVDIDESVIREVKGLSLPNSHYLCVDSLSQGIWQNPKIQDILSSGGFDLVVGNPPFSSWFHRIESADTLSNFELCLRDGKTIRSQAIEILFLELFMRLARKRGSIVIVLPDGVLANPKYQYVREFILNHSKVEHIVNLPRNIFNETSAKTSILILTKRNHGNLVYFTKIHDLSKTGLLNGRVEANSKNLIKRMDYAYYEALGRCSINELAKKGVKFVPLEELVVYCKTGKTCYGNVRRFTNRGVRFLHATNITEVGINYKRDAKFIDPRSKMFFPEALARVGDILFVRVGVGCAGRVNIIDVPEEEGIATDYLHILRVNKIDPYFLTVYLKTRMGKESINLLKHGVGAVSINKADLLSLQVPIIPEAFQKRIANRYQIILKEFRENSQDSGFLQRLGELVAFLEKSLNNPKELNHA